MLQPAATITCTLHKPSIPIKPQVHKRQQQPLRWAACRRRVRRRRHLLLRCGLEEAEEGGAVLQQHAGKDTQGGCNYQPWLLACKQGVRWVVVVVSCRRQGRGASGRGRGGQAIGESSTQLCCSGSITTPLRKRMELPTAHPRAHQPAGV